MQYPKPLILSPKESKRQEREAKQSKSSDKQQVEVGLRFGAQGLSWRTSWAIEKKNKMDPGSSGVTSPVSEIWASIICRGLYGV